MPRRNRNAGTPRLDTDQLAAELAWLAAELRPRTWTKALRSPGKTAALIRYLDRLDQAGYLLTVIDGKLQPTLHLTPGSR
jgi:hypothetical protein